MYSAAGLLRIHVLPWGSRSVISVVEPLRKPDEPMTSEACQA